ARTEETFGVAIINFPENPNTQRTRSSRTALIRATAGVRAFARSARDRGSPAVIGTSLRPVALRLRLSTGLPLSLKYQRQSVADCSQAPIMCRTSHVGLIRMARRLMSHRQGGAPRCQKRPAPTRRRA